MVSVPDTWRVSGQQGEQCQAGWGKEVTLHVGTRALEQGIIAVATPTGQAEGSFREAWPLTWREARRRCLHMYEYRVGGSLVAKSEAWFRFLLEFIGIMNWTSAELVVQEGTRKKREVLWFRCDLFPAGSCVRILVFRWCLRVMRPSRNVAKWEVQDRPFPVLWLPVLPVHAACSPTVVMPSSLRTLPEWRWCQCDAWSLLNCKSNSWSL